MTHKPEVPSAFVPKLLPIFGGGDKKPRLIDRDVQSVGRARGCDIALEAGDISAIHCILYRSSEGLRIRDCGSRTGTRVNGAMVKNVLLADGDMLQVGPFSFEVKLPANAPAPPPRIDEQAVERLVRSRRNLARVALALRKKVGSLRHGKSELGDKATDLKGKVRAYDEKFHQLEASERELLQEQELLDKEREDHHRHVQQVENELTHRLRDAETQIKNQWADFQKRCAQEQVRHQKDALSSATSGAKSDGGELHARLKELERREQEIKSREDSWSRRDEELSEEFDQIQRQCESLKDEKGKWQADSAKARQEIDQQRVALGQAETALREQKNELGKMVGDIKRMQEDLRKQGPEMKALQQENAQLREDFNAAVQRAAEPAGGPLVEELRAENEQLKQSLTENVKRLSDENQALRDKAVRVELSGASSKENDALRKENEQLRQLLQDQILKPAAPAPELEALREENSQLRHMLEDLDRAGLAGPAAANAAGAESSAPGLRQLQDENELLRQLLLEKDKFLDEIRGMPAAPGADEMRLHSEGQAKELDKLQLEIESLREQLAAKDQKLAEIKPNYGTPSREDIDLDHYEAELNQYRLQLEADRTKMGAELDSFRQRNDELNEATREMEMQLSRERAELARERMRLDRLRDEIKAEMDRIQRDGGVRESLASFQRLREDMKAGGRR